MQNLITYGIQCRQMLFILKYDKIILTLRVLVATACSAHDECDDNDSKDVAIEMWDMSRISVTEMTDDDDDDDDLVEGDNGLWEGVGDGLTKEGDVFTGSDNDLWEDVGDDLTKGIEGDDVRFKVGCGGVEGGEFWKTISERGLSGIYS